MLPTTPCRPTLSPRVTGSPRVAANSKVVVSFYRAALGLLQLPSVRKGPRNAERHTQTHAQIVSPALLPPSLFTFRKHWAKRLLPAPVFPTSRAEMDILGWDACDVILVTGDAYIDHPSFGAALVGRVLQEQGFRVGIIAQPRWQSAADFTALGKPAVLFGVTAGNMDSMVN